MKRALLIAALFLASCGHHGNIESVKKGMTDKQVISLMGEPTAKQTMPMNITWWRYGDDQVVVMENGTVANVVADAKASNDSINEVIDALKTVGK